MEKKSLKVFAKTAIFKGTYLPHIMFITLGNVFIEHSDITLLVPRKSLASL